MDYQNFSSITPNGLLSNCYSDYYFCGFDSQGNEIFQKASIAPSSALPAIEDLVAFSNGELVTLAHRIASAFKFSLPVASGVQARSYMEDLPYGIKLLSSNKSSLESLCKRLSDEKWWRRQIIKLADEKREHLAHLNQELGGRNPTQTCCTDRTIEMYRERQEITNAFLQARNRVIYSPDGEAYVFNLHEVAVKAKQNRLNELFLDIKALESIAEKKEFVCAFITLTASPEFHPNPKLGQNKYLGFSARQANQSLQKDWRSILDALDNVGVSRKSGEYFGFRVVEVHEDGCPHWHIALFFNDELGIIDIIEESIARLYKARGGYYEKHKEDIVRIIKKTGDDSASPSSYIFGYVLKALSEDGSDVAAKYKCAIRAMGARQYSFFGIKCATGKQRALKRVARLDDAPSHIKKQARTVHSPVDLQCRNEHQLAARVEFFECGSQRLTIAKAIRTNRYGEIVHTPETIKHDLDDSAVTIAPISEDISQEAADRLRCRET